MSNEASLQSIAAAMFAPPTANPAAAQPAADTPVAEAAATPTPEAEAQATTPEATAPETQEVATPEAEVVADPGDEQPEEEVDVPVAGDPNQAILAQLAGQPVATTKVHKRVVDALPNFGMTVEELVNYKQFKEQVEQERADLKAKQAELEQYAQASPELRAALIKDLQGDASWKKDILTNGVDFDFTKSADKQNPKALVNAFMPGKITEEQWKEYNDVDGDPKDKQLVSTMLEIASEKFAARAQQVNSEVEQRVAAQKQWVTNWQTSSEAAVGSLKQRMPAAGIYEQQLRQALSSPNAIMALFEEPGKPGVLRQDAAENLMMAIPEIRKKVLGASMAKEVKQAKGAAELAALKRSPDKPAPSNNSVKKPVAPAAPATLEDMARRLIGI